MVNAICPGLFPSRMTAYGLETAGEVMTEAHPNGRAGTPEDIGGIAIFLSSRAGSHVTGAAIAVDGGQNLQFMPRL